MDRVCGVCGETRPDTCQNCNMCLVCADECFQEGLGGCYDCNERLLVWSNQWRQRWRNAADMQHRLLKSVSEDLGAAEAEIERLKQYETIVSRLFEGSCWQCPSIPECEKDGFAWDAYNIGCDRLNCLGAK